MSYVLFLHVLCVTLWMVWRNGNCISHTNEVKLNWAQLILGLNVWQVLPSWYFPATHLGHPSMGRCNEYWRWFWPPLGKKRRVLCGSVSCD